MLHFDRFNIHPTLPPSPASVSHLSTPRYHRAPSASEKVLEEALSAAKRLLERLVTSARLHQDSAFLSPSPTADTNRGIGASTGDASSGRQHDIGSSEPSSRTRKFLRNAGQPLSRPYSPDFTPDCPGSKISVPDFLPNGASPDGVCVTPGEAATATLLSFRYPREPLFTSPSDGVGVWGVAVAAAGGRARQLADCHDDDDARASVSRFMHERILTDKKTLKENVLTHSFVY